MNKIAFLIKGRRVFIALYDISKVLDIPLLTLEGLMFENGCTDYIRSASDDLFLSKASACCLVACAKGNGLAEDPQLAQDFLVWMIFAFHKFYSKLSEQRDDEGICDEETDDEDSEVFEMLTKIVDILKDQKQRIEALEAKKNE